MAEQKPVERYLDFWNDELNSALIYRTLAEVEENPNLAEFYRRLAATEEGHAATWAKKMQEVGHPPPAFRPAMRTRILLWLSRRFGAQAILPSMLAMEDGGSLGYDHMPEAKGMGATERSHARLLRQIAPGGMEGPAVAQIEGRHRTAGGNALRAAVLGANDGLVSNLSLVMGVAGAELSGGSILVTGLAGLLAGAISMALGEWISVQSSRELYQNQLETEKAEIREHPEEEMEELALIYQARGLSESAARQLAGRIMSDDEAALETLARDELGIDPEELGGSAWEAAITSFVLFAIGAIIPVFPYFFLDGLPAVYVSAIASAAGLFLIGAAITLFTGRSVFSSGMRQVIFGLAAAIVTYVIGRLIGVSLAG